MISWLWRTLTFTRLALVDYLRSGRVLAEAAVLVAFVWIFFWPRGTTGLDPSQFFHLGGIFALLLASYSTFAFMSLGNRPQGYVVLARPIGRAGYLLGLQAAASVVVLGTFVAFTLLVQGLQVLAGQPLNLTLREWVLGSLPLALNATILSSFVTLVTPLVLSTPARVVVLGLLAVSLTRDLGVAAPFDISAVLAPLQTLGTLVVLPAAKGFELSVGRNYTLASVGVLLGQATLAAVLLALAHWSFSRRDLTLT